MNKRYAKEFILINVGLIILALSLHLFLIPNSLAAGGVSGFALVIGDYIKFLTVGQIIGILNIILLIIGFIFIGKEFGAKTIYCSVVFSGILMLFEKFFPMNKPLTNDLFIELLFGISIGAIGIAIVFEQNASTGGTDIIAKILNKYFKMDIGKSLLAADFLVTLLAAATFGPKLGMYALLGVILNGLIIDMVIEGFNVNIRMEIISNKKEEIQSYIMNELERGATIYVAKGAYTHNTKEVLTTVVGKKEFIKIKKFIKSIDNEAFIITYKVHETVGEGFKNINEV